MSSVRNVELDAKILEAKKTLGDGLKLTFLSYFLHTSSDAPISLKFWGFGVKSLAFELFGNQDIPINEITKTLRGKRIRIVIT